MSKGERLKELRLKHNFTLEEIGKKINVARQTYFKYENDIITNIPTDKIEALAKIYNVSEAYIMGWELPKENNAFLTADELRHIEKYRQLDADGQAEVNIIIDAKLQVLQAKRKATHGKAI